MPQALQWLGHWNRASFIRWQLRQSLPKSQRHSSSSWRRGASRCLCTASSLRSSHANPAAGRRRQRGDPFSPSNAVDPTTPSSGTISGRPLASEDDLNSFKWNDFVNSTRETAGTIRRPGTRWNTKPGHHFDAAQLCHELVVAQRRAGRDGVLQVWSSLVEQRGLSKVEGTEADFFYQSVLEAALPNDIILEGILLYADWLVDEHGICWPHLYDRVVSYCLESRQYKRAFRWHLSLMSGFDPGQELFTALISRHVHRNEPDAQASLRAMYITSHYRTVYDDVIPRLYGRGMSSLALEWRDLLAQHNDLPQHPVASQPFLHFLRSYYRGKTLTPPEYALASSEPRYRPTVPVAQQPASTPIRQDRPTPKNDAIGARFLASSWIGPEFAVHALQGLGIHSLGPLSLQSLALRDPNSASVLARLEQLESLEIHVGDSTYVKSIRHFAETGNDELLLALLQSDIHPEVFDDAHTQSQILANAIATGDWQTSRLLLAIQPVVARDSMQRTSNMLLRDHLLHHDVRAAIALMDEMRATKVEIHPETMETVFSHLLAVTARDIPLSPSTIQGIQGSIDLARSATSSQRMVPSQIWQNVLYQLGRSGQQTAMETLALAIVDGYRNKVTGKGGHMWIHPSDLPPWSAQTEGTDVPFDLPIAHIWHPINRILGDRKLQTSIIRWGFRAGLPLSSDAQLQSITDTCPIEDFSIARGARLLQQLGARGITLHLGSIRDEIVSCIASHMASTGKLGAKSPHRIPWSSLPEIRQLFTTALGRKVLPQAPVLRLLLLHAIRQEGSRGAKGPHV